MCCTIRKKFKDLELNKKCAEKANDLLNDVETNKEKLDHNDKMASNEGNNKKKDKIQVNLSDKQVIVNIDEGSSQQEDSGHIGKKITKKLKKASETNTRNVMDYHAATLIPEEKFDVESSSIHDERLLPEEQIPNCDGERLAQNDSIIKNKKNKKKKKKSSTATEDLDVPLESIPNVTDSKREKKLKKSEKRDIERKIIINGDKQIAKSYNNPADEKDFEEKKKKKNLNLSTGLLKSAIDFDERNQIEEISKHSTEKSSKRKMKEKSDTESSNNLMKRQKVIKTVLRGGLKQKKEQEEGKEGIADQQGSSYQLRARKE